VNFLNTFLAKVKLIKEMLHIRLTTEVSAFNVRKEYKMGNPMVMFIDDSETALASTRMTVSSMPIESKQYLEAQQCLADVKAGVVPDLIITDLNMPVMNGLELLKALRELPATKRTPVLMLTTETKDELKQQGKALGLTGWIVKPFNPTQLKSAITRVLRLPA